MNKRKRETQDLSARAAPAVVTENNDFAHQYLNEDATESNDQGVDFAALTQHAGSISGDNSSSHAHPSRSAPSGDSTGGMAPYHTMTVPQPTEQAFLNQSTENGDRAAPIPMDQTPISQHRPSDFGTDMEFSALKDSQNANGESPTGLSNTMSASKPAVGSDEWHKVRKDNHKEVERRRRETINEGINELAKIVPGCEKNKGSILARAVQFITQLKENETNNIEKWTLEKLLTEQAIAELSSSCDKLKAECQRAWSEVEQWKKAAQAAGISIDTDEKPAEPSE